MIENFVWKKIKNNYKWTHMQRQTSVKWNTNSNVDFHLMLTSFLFFSTFLSCDKQIYYVRLCFIHSNQLAIYRFYHKKNENCFKRCINWFLHSKSHLIVTFLWKLSVMWTVCMHRGNMPYRHAFSQWLFAIDPIHWYLSIHSINYILCIYIVCMKL